MLYQKFIIFLFFGLFSLINQAGAGQYGHSFSVDTGKTFRTEYGIASYYADKFEGRKTANGDIFSQKKLTAAHNILPLGTYIKVTNLRNNKSVKVLINDRLHRKNKRLVDLSKAAAQKIGFLKMGITRVKIEVVP